MRLHLGLLMWVILVSLCGGAAQEANLSPPAIKAMKVCTAMNPPPCALPPQAISAPDPEYTEEARKAKIEGRVVLWVVISQDGVPEDIRVQHSLDPGLNQKAIEAVRKWKFRPGTYHGNPVAVQINIEVNFRLFGKEADKSAGTAPIPELSKEFGWKIESRTYSSTLLGMMVTIPEGWTLVTQHHGQNAPAMAMFAKYGSLTNVLLAREHLEVSAETIYT